MDDNIETLWKSYEVVNENVRFSDTKAGTILAVDGIIASLVLSGLVVSNNALYQILFFKILFVSGVFTLFLSTFCALKCLAPTLKVGEPTSLIYFGHIAQKYSTPSEYEKAAKKVFSHNEQALSQISQQVWANSHIAWKKFTAVTWATRFLGATIFISISGTILAFFVS